MPNSTNTSITQNIEADQKPFVPNDDGYYPIEGNPNITLKIDLNNSDTNSPSKIDTIVSRIRNSWSCLSDKRGKISSFKDKNRPSSSKNSSEYLYLDFALREVYSLPETHDPNTIVTSSDGESLIPATHMIETEDGGIYLVSSIQGARELICSQE